MVGSIVNRVGLTQNHRERFCHLVVASTLMSRLAVIGRVHLLFLFFMVKYISCLRVGSHELDRAHNV